ncbi:MAG: helix-turn-helix domain-containing protein [Pseudonocardiaceae bacterium]|nr:helix-turn-helix domain-containing protein [Pseudonocardiaceae bacterium]
MPVLDDVASGVVEPVLAVQDGRAGAGRYPGSETTPPDREQVSTPLDAADTADIGQRARTIRRRRGLSLEVAAGLAGICTSYLSRLERGERRFDRGGLLSALAEALGCSVIDLTGQPYLPADRAGADALATLPGIRVAIYDAPLDDPPDVSARPVAELVRRANAADAARDQNRYALAGAELGTLLTELQVIAATGRPDDRRTALAALVQAAHVAAAVAEAMGHQDLALAAAAREHEAAARLGDPTLLGLARYGWAQTWAKVGARRRATSVVAESLADLDVLADPLADYTGPAEMAGMAHLISAKLAARAHRADDAASHLDHAAELAERTGERNTAYQHFGPTNVALWRVGVGADLGGGGAVYERAMRDAPDLDVLDSATRSGNYHFDLARALVSDEGDRDAEALRHLDTADRYAPQLIRHNPIARDLLGGLEQRARRRVWELDSLRNRFGVG